MLPPHWFPINSSQTEEQLKRDNKEKQAIETTNPIVPKMYGLPKINKLETNLDPNKQCKSTSKQFNKNG